MDQVIETLVDEVLTLQAEVAALRVLLGASLSGDPRWYFDLVAPNIDALTLPLVMNEKQRDIVRDRVESTRELWMNQQRAAHPGGLRGVRNWLASTGGKMRRVFAGSH